MWFDLKDKRGVEKYNVYRSIEEYLNTYRRSQEHRKPVLYLYNFKCFKGFHAIELADLTYLYGANSTGKSTIYQAIEEAIDVLSHETSLAQSAKNNKSWGLSDKDLYGIGLGGVWGEDWGGLQRIGECYEYGMHSVESQSFVDLEEKVYAFYSDFHEEMHSESIKECWDVFVITGSTRDQDHQVSFYVWWQDQLFFNYDSSDESFQLHRLLDSHDIDWTENLHKAVEGCDTWFDIFEDRKLIDLEASTDDEISIDIRFDKENKNRLSLSDLRPDNFLKKYGINLPEQGEMASLTDSYNSNPKSKRITNRIKKVMGDMSLATNFNSVEIQMDRALGEKKFLYENHKGEKIYSKDKGNQILSEWFTDWESNLWDEKNLEHAFVQPKFNIVVQIFLYFLIRIPVQVSRAFRCKKLSSLRLIPTDKDMRSTWSIVPDSDDAALKRPVSRRLDCDGGFVWDDLSESVLESVYPDNSWKVDGGDYEKVNLVKDVNRFFKSKLFLNSKYQLNYAFTEKWLMDKNGIYQSDFPDEVEVAFFLMNNRDKTCFTEIGTGFSQVLPVVVTLLSEKRYFISQPELHLHPKRAHALGSLLVQSISRKEKLKRVIRNYKNPKTSKEFKRAEVLAYSTWGILETHSKELLDPALSAVKSGKLSPQNICIYVLTQDKGVSSLTKVRVDEDGDFMDSWPGGYFDEAMY